MLYIRTQALELAERINVVRSHGPESKPSKLATLSIFSEVPIAMSQKCQDPTLLRHQQQMVVLRN